MNYRPGDRIHHLKNVNLAWEIISVEGERVGIRYATIPELIREVSKTWVAKSYVVYQHAKRGRVLDL